MSGAEADIDDGSSDEVIGGYYLNDSDSKGDQWWRSISVKTLVETGLRAHEASTEPGKRHFERLASP